jgi:hypothetical protein
LKETRCEVCGERVDILSEYQDKIQEQVYQPREWLEKQLNMSEEEKEERTRYFEELLRRHAEQKLQGNGEVDEDDMVTT